MNSVCRACLSTESVMIPLDESFINSYNLLTNLNISLGDGRPQQCCRDCAQTLEFCAEFRQKCITSESTLKQLKTEKTEFEETDPVSDTTQLTSDTIKAEVKNENNDDSTFEYTYRDFVEAPEEDEHLNLSLKTGNSKEGKPKRSRAKRKKAGAERKTAEPAEPEALSCGLCGESAPSAAELSAHLERHRLRCASAGHGACGTCGERFASWPPLLAHRLRHGGATRCHLCGKHHRCYVALEHHYLQAHCDGEKPSRLACKLCQRTYETPRKLKKHILSAHSEKVYICDHCSKMFHNKTVLKSHLKSHYDKKEFACDLCDFTCKYSGGLKWSRHMARHSGAARFACPRCEASFRTRGALRVHCDRHDGRRSKHCEFCPLSFYSASVLIKHRRTHTGEKPYVCKECGKAFTGNHNLKVHMRVHGQDLVVRREASTAPLPF